MDRRTFIAAGGAVLLSSVSGCGALGSGDATTDDADGGGTGNGSGGGDAGGTPSRTGTATPTPPASFEDVFLSAPATATVDEEVTVEVAAHNAGGKPGTYEAVVEIVGDDQYPTRTVRIGEVPPGGVGRGEVSFSFGYASDYRFGVRGTDATAGVSVMPTEARTGESMALGDRFELGVDGASAYDSVFYLADAGTDRERREVFDPDRPGTPGPAGTLVAYRLSVKNAGSGAATFDPAPLTLPGGRILTDSDLPAPLSAVETIEGAPIAGREIPGGSTESGWLLAVVPTLTLKRSVASESSYEGLAFEYSRPDADAFDPRNERPERRWIHDPDEFGIPEFEVSVGELPPEHVAGRPLEATVTVRNTGTGAGTFRGVAHAGYASTGTERVETERLDVEAGGTAEWTVQFRPEYAGQAVYRFVPGGTAEVSVSLPSKRVGETYDVPGRPASLTVDRVVLTDELTVRGEDGPEKRPAPGDSQWALVEVRVDYAGASDWTPPAAAWSVRGRGARAVLEDSTVDSELFSPVSGSPWSAVSGSHAAGDRVTAYLVVQLPDSTEKGDVRVGFADNDGPLRYGTTWRATPSPDGGDSGDGSDGGDSGSGSDGGAGDGSDGGDSGGGSDGGSSDGSDGGDSGSGSDGGSGDRSDSG